MSKILLAEDDTDMRRFLVKALQNAGFDVTSYDNGLSAYHRLREEPFELLLTDIVMPEMDGIELARRAAELDPDIKIMFITGFAAVALNPDSNAPKQAKVLSKPIHLRKLASEAQQMLPASRLLPARPPRFGADRSIPFRARSSAEEHYLDMVGVTGSIPVAPTIYSGTSGIGPPSIVGSSYHIATNQRSMGHEENLLSRRVFASALRRLD